MPFTAAKLHIIRGCFVPRHRFVFAHVRAYAIRPYNYSTINKAPSNYNKRLSRKGQKNRYSRESYVLQNLIKLYWCPANGFNALFLLILIVGKPLSV